MIGRIREDLSELQRIADRIQLAWERASQTGDDFYIDGTALNLHSFYTGFEVIFELIATSFDESKLKGKNWHQELPRQMAAEIPMVRAAVISTESRKSLDEYRGFRHVVRNVYAFNLDPDRMEHLVKDLPVVFERLHSEIVQFLQGIEAANNDQNNE
ncbi:MAG: hypothetical protein M0Z41_15675 [Peptococcaceae bacterium]|nr:hypothetical protein [Peptococcaceae bacterium]